jgi:GH24 family phage-related lysozyme (muramidase)
VSLSPNEILVDLNLMIEGKLDFMYLDKDGQVTTGIGHLLNSVDAAQRVPFIVPGEGGRLATPTEIAQDWERVHQRKDLRLEGGGRFRDIARLRLTEATIARLFEERTAIDVRELKVTSEFATFESWPMDAQIALRSMAYAAGPAFARGGRFRLFREACAALNFEEAANQCRMDDSQNPGLRPRNAANVAMFQNAFHASGAGADPAQLFYPAIALDDGNSFLPEVRIEMGTIPDLNVLHLQKALNNYHASEQQQGRLGLIGCPLKADGSLGSLVAVSPLA